MGPRMSPKSRSRGILASEALKNPRKDLAWTDFVERLPVPLGSTHRVSLPASSRSSSSATSFPFAAMMAELSTSPMIASPVDPTTSEISPAQSHSARQKCRLHRRRAYVLQF